MATQSDAFIHLDRTFSKIRMDGEITDDTDLGGRHGRSGELRWPDLLSHQRVVLLSEAGSGKTAEIRNVTRRLRTEGKTAFFLRVENVMSELEDAFEEGSFEEFERWLSSDTQGWLLLDSVDEARLGDPREFERAIRKLGRLTRGIGAKAHILITGRTNAWRASTDLEICERAFEFEANARHAPSLSLEGVDGALHMTASKPQSDASFLVVTLDDIHGEQIDRFLESTGVQNAKAFRTAVERREAESLTTRPLDFLELVDFWHEHHRIGTRLELMKSSIDRRLVERDQNRAEFRPIAPGRLREGVRLLAAATTLGRNAAIRVPDGDAIKKGIPVRSVLIGWDDAEVGALLSRPIFEPGIYGTVRFHHRTVREYLAAEWLHELIRGAASRVKIENLFFRTQYGLQVINPSMRPVLPWLAILDGRICTRLEELAPEVFFEGGDPGQLPLSTRQNILRKTCEQLAQPAHSWAITDYSSVQRFAHSDLTDDIIELLVLYRSNDDIVWFLLRMVWHGEVVGALAEVKHFALHADQKYTRLAAMRAVIDLGTPQDIADVRHELLAGEAKLSREWLAEVIDGLSLDSEWLPWLLHALERTENKERFSGRDTLVEKLYSLLDACRSENLPAFIQGLSELLDKPPLTEQDYSAISEQNRWLVEIAGAAVLRLLQARDPFTLDKSALSILSKLAHGSDYAERDDRDLDEMLREAVPAWPELDYKLFWYDVAEARKGRVHREPVTQVWQLLGFNPYWSINKMSFGAACNDIVILADEQDRVMALSMAFSIFTEHGKPNQWEDQLKSSTGHHPELRGQLEAFLNPPKQDTQEWEIKKAQWEEKSARRKSQEAERRRSWREGLAADVGRINNPKPGLMTQSQAYLLEFMRERSSSNKWASSDWSCLIDEFGLPVAQAFRDGAIDFWRGYRPVLPSEGAAPNSTPYHVIFGLSGLAIEAKEQPLCFAQMSVEDARNAARYGLLELNGFPEWLPALVKIHPGLIQEIVAHEVRYEMDTPHTEPGGNRVLQRLRWGGEWMYEDLAASLLSRLKQPVEDLEAIQLALTVIHDSSINDDALGSLASKRALEESNEEIAPTWYAVWIGTQPSLAIPALASRIESLESDDAKAKFAMLSLIALVGSRTASRCRQNYKAVEHAKSLYLLMHTYVRIADDIDRTGGGVYSPGLRDDAQHARDGLLAIIRETPGKASFLALQEIAEAHPAESLRPWSAFYAQQKATAGCQTPPWEPEKVIDFNNNLESTPSTHRELWNLAIDRLLDLKHLLEESDSSWAELLLPSSQETSVRKYIGDWCRDRAAGRYAVSQEEQLADDKRPDYRFLNTQFDAPVPVELKLSQNWSGPDHFERLENQLCGDYLRDDRSSCGIFLLVSRNDQTKWQTPNGDRVGFEGLVNALQEHWLSIASRYPGAEDIKVIGIDLTKRGGQASAKAIKAVETNTPTGRDDS
ncbi:hypothetical protein [Pseudomonas sp. RC3H12]|uniref:NACHT domain-containing protein n=1 Tax=Pseudomonas sp. RC3H12 TaxID=2834406 RepID=UPI001BDF6068|nr:hypothetical protein [Pseudomonas sp. RC3H12]QWA30544.1 hypothetical protein KHO27_06620 [Pseudomonas sp. RC3H12]